METGRFHHCVTRGLAATLDGSSIYGTESPTLAFGNCNWTFTRVDTATPNVPLCD